MKKIFLTLIASFAVQAVAHDLVVNLGGTVDLSNTTINSAVSYINKDLRASPYSQYIDIDNIYKSSASSGVTENLFDVYAKVNYELGDGKNYLQTAGRYQYDEFGTYKNLVVFGVGHGYRVLRTDTVKLSAETSIAQAESVDLNQTVFRESVWASYQINNKSTVSEKYLIESGGTFQYQKNVMSLRYQLTDDVAVSISNTWIKDSINNKLTNATVFGLGMKF